MSRSLQLFFIVCFLAASCAAQTLRIATVNIWSGIDYAGTLSVGTVEEESRRDARLALLIRELRALDADIIALQEVNPAAGLSCDIADELGYDAVAQRVNAGIKVGPMGVPWNLNEGIALLARRDLRLELVDVVDLSHNFGAIGNALSFHFSENNIALVARVRVDNAVLHIINVHLDASVPDTPATRDTLASMLRQRAGADVQSVIREFEIRAARRREQAFHLREYLDENLAGRPLVLLGDFNTSLEDPDLQVLISGRGLTEASGGLPPTWDPAANENVLLSRGIVGRTDADAPLAAFGAWHDGKSRSLDHILAGPNLAMSDRKGAGIFLDRAEAGIHASDHYGVYADVDVTAMLAGVPHDGDNLPRDVHATWEYFPVPVYDSNYGLAFVGKTLLVNQFGARESVDAMAFFSIKGEKLFNLTLSFPHTDVRQGRVYAIAADAEIEYDWNPEYNFYGLGNNTPFESGEKITREYLDAALTFSRGWTPTFVTDMKFRYRMNRNTDIPDSGILANTPDARGTERVAASSLRLSARYDTRDIFFNPSRGIVAALELEYAPALAVRDAEYGRIGAALQWYGTLFYPRTVLAARIMAQSVLGRGIPVHYLPSIGGSNSQRGLTANRFVDKTTAVANLELRFPVLWRFGGVLGLDAGKVWPDPLRMDLSRWSVGRVVGIRLYYDTFVARADIGFGSESTGLYLNFGQAF